MVRTPDATSSARATPAAPSPRRPERLGRAGRACIAAGAVTLLARCAGDSAAPGGADADQEALDVSADADAIVAADAVDDAVDAAADAIADAAPSELDDAEPDQTDMPETGADTDRDAPTLPPFPAALAAELDAALLEFAPRVEAPGLTVTVELLDGSQWTDAWGVRSTITGERTRSGDRFRIGSVTKTFVASLVLELIASGELALDASVATILPIDGLDPAVTPRMLLGHTSGIVDYTDIGDFIVRAQQPASPDEVIDYALGEAPVFEPGAGWSYSNTGYYLLGRLLEETLEQDIAHILRERRLVPVGLDDTFLQPDEAIPGGFVDGHLLGAENTNLTHMSWAWAAGGMVSNGQDLCRWARALFAGDLLDEGSLRLLTEPQSLAPANERYGLGVRTARRGGLDVWGHTGSTTGFRGELFWDPASGTCVAVLTNDFFADQQQLSEPIWERIARFIER